ncbi:two-component system, chemotaxis family, chemotaxis protein CheY [Gammaproteobacteria bacterium]
MTKKTILTVDDSASVRQVVTITLESAGYGVVQASDGQEALVQLKTTAVDMIITDINMPNLNGIELIRQVRTTPGYKFTPIVLLTTVTDEAKKQEGRAVGATAWITKPFTPEQLRSVVKKVLG